jgi:hypothetical protein
MLGQALPCLATYVLASYKFSLTDIRPLIANICGGAFNWSLHSDHTLHLPTLLM